MKGIIYDGNEHSIKIYLSSPGRRLGVSLADVLQYCAEDLKKARKTAENKNALTKLEEAIFWLTKDDHGPDAA